MEFKNSAEKSAKGPNWKVLSLVVASLFAVGGLVFFLSSDRKTDTSVPPSIDIEIDGSLQGKASDKRKAFYDKQYEPTSSHEEAWKDCEDAFDGEDIDPIQISKDAGYYTLDPKIFDVLDVDEDALSVEELVGCINPGVKNMWIGTYSTDGTYKSTGDFKGYDTDLGGAANKAKKSDRIFKANEGVIILASEPTTAYGLLNADKKGKFNTQLDSGWTLVSVGDKDLVDVVDDLKFENDGDELLQAWSFDSKKDKQFEKLDLESDDKFQSYLVWLEVGKEGAGVNVNDGGDDDGGDVAKKAPALSYEKDGSDNYKFSWETPEEMGNAELDYYAFELGEYKQGGELKKFVDGGEVEKAKDKDSHTVDKDILAKADVVYFRVAAKYKDDDKKYWSNVVKIGEGAGDGEDDGGDVDPAGMTDLEKFQSATVSAICQAVDEGVVADFDGSEFLELFLDALKELGVELNVDDFDTYFDTYEDMDENEVFGPVKDGIEDCAPYLAEGTEKEKLGAAFGLAVCEFADDISAMSADGQGGGVESEAYVAELLKKLKAYGFNAEDENDLQEAFSMLDDDSLKVEVAILEKCLSEEDFGALVSSNVEEDSVENAAAAEVRADDVEGDSGDGDNVADGDTTVTFKNISLDDKLAAVVGSKQVTFAKVKFSVGKDTLLHRVIFINSNDGDSTDLENYVLTIGQGPNFVEADDNKVDGFAGDSKANFSFGINAPLKANLDYILTLDADIKDGASVGTTFEFNLTDENAMNFADAFEYTGVAFPLGEIVIRIAPSLDD